MIGSFIERIPYARMIGLEIERDEHGIVCLMPFQDHIIGNDRLPAVHGGVVGAFLELAALVQLIEETGTEKIAKPINFSIDYLRTAGPKTSRARAEIVKHGRRIANVRVIGWQDTPEKPFAAGIGNFLL